MTASTHSPMDTPATDQQQMFRDLRKAKERRARVAALLEARRERHVRIERVLQVQRQRRVRQAR